ncbi:SHOCT domain-containing protein [Candidatus Peregrinibacteria bacterium]|nr:MAG: SHOCT domain-containing protein [Candidatus Peregrinibacteria bacterium]
MGFGFLFFFIFWGIVIYLAFIAFKHFTEKKDGETPLELLKKRLAKGGITEEEFERIKKKL